MKSDISGDQNSALGARSLYTNTGDFNTAMGYEALFNNTTGLRNTASGHSTLKANTDGDNNTAVGIFALENNTTADHNTALGYSAHSNAGNYTNSTGIGSDADPSASNRVHIGNASVTWIGGAVSWSTYSDARFKTNINENISGLEFIKRLRPVSYNLSLDAILDWKDAHYGKQELIDFPGKYEIETHRFSGFIAQEVEEASSATGYDFSGVCAPANDDDFYALRYAEFVVPLVKAIQELTAVVEAQQMELNALREQLDGRPER
jgi:hypothetical protein